jgi:flagellar basal-body rod protein FlgB
MATNLGGATASIVEYALDGLSLRHSAIAANIANANSVGYRPLQVSFENMLAGLIDGGNVSSTMIANLPKPTVSEAVPTLLATGENAVEMQPVLLNQNVVQHQALITGLNKYISTLATAINEGKR